MTGFDASEQALLAAGSRMTELESEIREDFAPVRQEAEALLDSGWSGGAARGFANGWQQWLTGYEDCMSALAAMGRLLQRTGHGYGAAEDVSTTVVDSSATGLQ